MKQLSWIDNSGRSTFNRCPYAYYLSSNVGLRPVGSQHALAFGGAFASALNALRSSPSAPLTDALAATFWPPALTETPDPKGIRTLNRFTHALHAYLDKWEITPESLADDTSNHGALVSSELPFSVLLPGTDTAFVGRMDAIVRHHGEHWVVDEKTTSQLGATWAPSWQLSGQMLGYTWAASKLGYKPVGCFVRGICLLTRETVLAQAMVLFSSDALTDWLISMLYTIERINECNKRGIFPKIMNEYLCKQCSFFDYCTGQNMDGYEVSEPWNPLAGLDQDSIRCAE